MGLRPYPVIFDEANIVLPLPILLKNSGVIPKKNEI